MATPPPVTDYWSYWYSEAGSQWGRFFTTFQAEPKGQRHVDDPTTPPRLSWADVLRVHARDSGAAHY